jgi:hypothetical protein
LFDCCRVIPKEVKGDEEEETKSTVYHYSRYIIQYVCKEGKVASAGKNGKQCSYGTSKLIEHFKHYFNPEIDLYKHMSRF